MNFQNLRGILDKVSKKRIGVIGDCCLDIYWEADMKLSELSLETPQFPLPIVSEKFYLGSAGNIVNNLSTLEVDEIDFITVVGDDWRKTIVFDLLENMKNVNTKHIIVSKERVTPAYCKPIKQGISDVVYEDSRLDFWNLGQISNKVEEDIINRLNEMAKKVDAIIVEDQLKNGVMTDKIREVISELGRNGKTIIVDSREYAHKYKNVMLKPNDKELINMANNLNLDIDGMDIVSVAREISNKINKDIIVTLGEKGSIWVSENETFKKDIFKVEGEIDIVGAGDGFIAGLAAFYDSTSKENILSLCNLMSSIIIKKIGITGSASKEEILKNYVLKLEKPYFEKLNAMENKDIKCALFDFDGTISTLRHGWEDIMFDYVYEQLHQYYMGRDKELTDKIKEFIRDTTGVQTIFQMQWIVEQVKLGGGKPLDQWEYKDGYNKALLEVVRTRADALLQGKMKPIDFRVPGSKEFIEKLVSRGIKCYIASGTDDDDIKKEMKAIEVENLFEDSKGAPYRKAACPKEAVYRKLIEELSYKPNEILVVGDGKVEINLGVNNGSLTLGVACDEYSLQGIDLKKRDRLVKARAHGIVMDFNDYNSILEWING
ncbi:hypothetical protein SH1V18_40110 [Vallitalea longa]|uniref:Carbohydrate kinase PfkB domain-containing protein n=1 Tax=Vallitalea longa TaxID=2936439 RepID=A0A9W6DFR8_9FIRM|nr:PfkB family carbohydrate kinase [Vallitalea longa]GKX31531.1 hypothetical protein SH1V18_40110 [Vallitalea longa]